MIDITKKYKTRNGQNVKLLSDKGRGQYPVLGYIGKRTTPSIWTLEGRYTISGNYADLDLIEVKEPKVLKCWVNFYTDGSCRAIPTKEMADAWNNDGHSPRYRHRIGEAVEVIKIV